jgi:hypothetical protein
MTGLDIDRERLLVFRVGEVYLFAEYFHNEALFADLEPYYDGDSYRFEVPAAEVEGVSERLRAAYYEPVPPVGPCGN